MGPTVGGAGHAGLERSCGDWLRSSGPVDGIELLEARFRGRGFEPHRHDTYGIAVTDLGVQTFDYRGSVERSLPGQVTVLHPDELHDGRAGGEEGFAYHIVYVAPARISAALRAITGKPTPLPFVRQAVAVSPRLAAAVRAAFAYGLEPLARDSLVERLAEGLLAADPSLRSSDHVTQVNLPAVQRARELLSAADRQRVSSENLERQTGLSRYELARQFRLAYGTSPQRYAVQRRLERARERLRHGEMLVDVALDSGFADQAHFTRMFRAAFGLSPGRYARLHVPKQADAAEFCFSFNVSKRSNLSGLREV